MIIPKADILNKGMGASASARIIVFVILKHIKIIESRINYAEILLQTHCFIQPFL